MPAGLSNVVAISGGSFHSLALKYDGTVVAWGDDSAGQIDVPAAALSNVVAIAAGGFHSLALKSDGSVVSWGDNSAGQTAVPTGLTNFVAIAAGDLHSLALTPQSIASLTNIVLNLTNGVPQTNNILPGTIIYYKVNVPPNADFATNLLLSANAPLNIWFITNTPPTTNAATVLMAGSTNGISILSTNSIPTNIVPGTVYYLGVQNTNTITVNYAVEVDFHLVTAPLIVIDSITATNIGGKFGFLLTWFAPSNDLFQVQWTGSLVPATWATFTNIVGYNTNVVVTNPANAQFNFFDDASQTAGVFGPMRFYRLILLGSQPGLTNGLPQTNSVAPGNTAYFSVTVPTNADFATNTLVFATAPVNLLFNQTALPSGTNAGSFTLLANSTGGSSLLSSSTVPPLVPGATYYLGVQNTNSVAVNFALLVNFHLLPATNNPVNIFSITPTGIGATNGFLLKWYAPTNDIFQVQWTGNSRPRTGRALAISSLTPVRRRPRTACSPSSTTACSSRLSVRCVSIA